MTGDEAVARHLAERGPEAIEKMAAIVARAREMLADPQVLATPDPLAGHTYGWQAEERFNPGTPKRLYVGSVEDDATGFGLSVWVAVALARTDGEFRRIISRHVGFDLADAAIISDDPSASVPYRCLISDSAFRNIASGGPDVRSNAAAFEAVLRCHVDYG